LKTYEPGIGRGVGTSVHLEPFQCSAIIAVPFPYPPAETEPTAHISLCEIIAAPKKLFLAVPSSGVGTTVPEHIADTAFVEANIKLMHADKVRNIIDDFTVRRSMGRPSGR
jgi:hypothetical protein